MNKLITKRCDWCLNNDLYIEYHDNEWGIPIYDDRSLFELFVLETMQAGLSWITILKKRAYFKKAFDNFDIQKVANYDKVKLCELLTNNNIIRNSLKIKAAINNANKFIEIQETFGSFSNYIWSFTEGKTIFNNPSSVGEIPCNSDLSNYITKDLKYRKFKFLGTKIVYAFLQSMGIVNDHLIYCFLSKNVKNKKS